MSDSTTASSVVLRTISEASAAATLAGHLPPDGPLFIGRSMIPVWGRGFAIDVARVLIGLARANPDIALIIAHTPVDRPASGRVLTKAGFALIGETDDEHDGVPIRLYRWELRLTSDQPGQTSA